MKITNPGNIRIYRYWAPIYDAVAVPFFAPGRRRAMKVVNVRPGESVLLAGVGTGADLPLLPGGSHAVGIDLSANMLEKARRKASDLKTDIRLVCGDAQDMSFETASFDVAVLNLVLAVVPDATQCLREAIRVVRPGGRLVIFDKFIPDGTRPPAIRRLVNRVTTAMGTDINRSFADIAAAVVQNPGTDPGFRVVSDEPSILFGMYRVILLERT